MKDSNESESWKWVKWRVSRMSTFINKGDCSTTTRHYSDLVDMEMEWNVLPSREAARQGADLIECDLALTKDRALICSHAPYLRFSTTLLSHHCSKQPNWRHWAILCKYCRFWIPSHNLYLTLSFVLDVIIICWLWVIIDQSYQPYLIITIHVSIAKQNHCISAKALTLAQSLSLRTD